MFLFDSHCYADLQSVIDSIASTPITSSGAVVSSVSSSGASSINIQMAYPKANGSLVYNTVSYSPPACSALGFNSSYSGLTISNSVDLYQAGGLVLLMAFLFVAIRRVIK